MATTYAYISKTILSSNQSTITFSSIPSTYTDLVLRIDARSSIASNVTYAYVQVNGDTGANYNNGALLSNNSTVTYSAQSGQNQARIAWIGGNNFTYWTGPIEIYFGNYKGSTSIKTFVSDVTWGGSITGANSGFQALNRGSYTGSSSAISSITLTLAAGDYISGSSFHLYGVKNS